MRLLPAALILLLLTSCEAMGTDYVGIDPTPVWAPQITEATFEQNAPGRAALHVEWRAGRAPFHTVVHTPPGFEEIPSADGQRRLITLTDIDFDLPASGDYTIRVVITDDLGQQAIRELTAHLLVKP
jgi:hypothetical protein